MNIEEAKATIDKIINKARVHLYKPIQVAEILYRDRTKKDIDLSNLSTYRTPSRKWRDIICLRFLNSTSKSSARYQDDVFNKNAVPPGALIALGKENRKKKGIVEAYIYRRFLERFTQLSGALDYTILEFELSSLRLILYARPLPKHILPIAKTLFSLSYF